MIIQKRKIQYEVSGIISAGWKKLHKVPGEI